MKFAAIFGLKTVHCKKKSKWQKAMNTEQKTYSCIIVDDNELDRMAIASYAGKYSFLRIEGVFCISGTGAFLDSAVETARYSFP